MRIILFTLLFISSLFASKVVVATAANASYAVVALKQAFLHKHPKSHIEIITASSGKLTAQIAAGAPYDIFLSANMRYPNFLYKKGFALTHPKVYAKGALVLLSKSPRKSLSLELLQEPQIQKIAIANPKTAPYGEAAFEALKNAKLLDSIKEKFIYGESISQTLLYTLKVADVGIVAKSLLYASRLKKFQNPSYFYEIDAKLYTPIKQGALLLVHAKANNTAKEFFEFLFSKEAKRILKSYGYIVE